MGPWAAIRASVTHHVPGHRLTPQQAFAAHTVGGWAAAGDDVSGRIAVGAPTHLAVWDSTAFPDVTGSELPTCLRTVVAGRTVYSDQEP
jgi:hypothetical protein